jgi:glutamate synthase domain-containing protein 2
MMIYQWKPGSQSKGDAQIVGETLEEIRVRSGRLTASTVLEEAVNPESPIHGAFTWDDTEAAQQYRLEQARHLIRSVVMVREDEPGQPTIRAFVSIREDGDQEYTNIVTAMSDRALRKQVVARALAELKDWRKRYNELREFAKVFEAIDQMGPD